jgi:hypothetical protein
MGGYAMSKSASVYDVLALVEEQWHTYDPFTKRENAVGLSKLASEGVIVPDHILQYAGEGLNPHFAELMRRRRQDWVSDDDLGEDYNRLEKLASAGQIDLDDAVEALYLLDEQANLLTRYGDRLPDPVLCVYGGGEKEAEVVWEFAGRPLPATKLAAFVASEQGQARLHDVFQANVVRELVKTGGYAYEAMPLEQKRVLLALVG